MASTRLHSEPKTPPETGTRLRPPEPLWSTKHPPDTTIASGPSGPTSDPTPSFEFSSEPRATFECRVGSDAFSSMGKKCRKLGLLCPGKSKTVKFKVKVKERAKKGKNPVEPPPGGIEIGGPYSWTVTVD